MIRDNKHSTMGNEAKKAKRDNRKSVAIAHYDNGLEAKEIAKELGISTRTANLQVRIANLCEMATKA